MCFGGGAPTPPPVPPPEKLPTPEELARSRRLKEAKRQGRQSLIIDPAVNTVGGGSSSALTIPTQ